MLGELVALEGDLSLVPGSHTRQPIPPIILVPGDLMPFRSGLPVRTHNPHTHVQAHMHTHTANKDWEDGSVVKNLAALAEQTLVQFSASIWQLTTTVIPVLRDWMPYSDPLGLLPACDTYILIQDHTILIYKMNIFEMLTTK